ncbi:MAG TPA: hypothetical protein VK151_13670 [Fluviicola sp.]|nr:hypothetical protein [Fluviicola sp.]
MFTLNPNDDNFLNTLTFLLKLFGGLGAFYLFFIGFRRYKKDQTWKKNEFVAKEIREFTSDKIVRNAMFMLDWGERYIELFPNKESYSERFAKVDRNVLMLALQPHELRIKEHNKDRFTEIEVAIRDTFDHFLAYFERFYQFIEAGLITEVELEPYLNYWIKTISTDIEDNVKYAIHHYINRYGFSGTQKLFRIFGKDILPKN